MFRVNGLLFVFWFFLICPPPPLHPPVTVLLKPVLCNCGLGESAGRTLNWKLVMFPPPPTPLLSFLLLLLVTGSCFFGKGSLDIKLIIKPVGLCPASLNPVPTFPPPPPPSSTIWGIPAFPWCSCTSCDLTRSNLQAIYFTSRLPPPPHPL